MSSMGASRCDVQKASHLLGQLHERVHDILDILELWSFILVTTILHYVPQPAGVGYKLPPLKGSASCALALFKVPGFNDPSPCLWG